LVILSSTEQTEDAYWLALSDSPIPPEAVLSYYEQYHSVEGLWKASRDQLKSLTPQAANRFVEYRTKTNVKNLLASLSEIKREKIEIITIVDPRYPPQLRQVTGQRPNSPPLVLLRAGQLTVFQNCVAVVGTRQCTHFGNRMARLVGSSLASRGYTIVSGLARGIDSESHLGALDARGKTVAVLAWMRPVYPPENLSLLSDIAKTGAVLSERYLSPRGMAGHLFVERNRITSGLSQALVIIESQRTGGTAWQFDFAREQKRPIFVLRPESLSSSIGKGFLHFVERGAVPFSSTDELIRQLEAVSSSAQKRLGDVDSQSFYHLAGDRFADDLIRRSTGNFGEFKMQVCLAIIRTERFSRGWFDILRQDKDAIRKVLSRYKQQVRLSNLPVNVVKRELTELAAELGVEPEIVARYFDSLQS